MDQITQIVFSPGGTTARVAGQISAALAQNVQTVDLLNAPLDDTVLFGPDQLVLAAMPVFSGRIPGVCLELLKRLKGNGTPAVAVVVYGNRAFEDALLELSNLLESQGFVVIGAAAFVAQHSIFPQVAKGRPDAADEEKAKEFALGCLSKLKAKYSPVSVPGNRPYREAGTPPLRPSGSTACTNCGVCAKICPAGAIDAATPRKTDKERCIACTACIYACPYHARAFHGLLYKIAGRSFAKKNSARKEPEIFL